MKKKYLTPTITIIAIKQHSCLMITSGTEGNRNDYGTADEEEW